MLRIAHFGILTPEVLKRALDLAGDVMEGLGAAPRPVKVARRGKKR